MKKIAYSFFMALIMASCASTIPFTQSIRDEYKLNEAELRKLQFYASHDIILQKSSQTEKSKGTAEGALVLKQGKSIEEVFIKSGTPGIVEQVVDGNRLAISFEEGNGKYIVFGDPELKNGRYTLLAADWKNNRGVLQYGGSEYVASSGASNVYLKFKMKKLNQLRKEVTVAKGRKIK